MVEADFSTEVVAQEVKEDTIDGGMVAAALDSRPQSNRSKGIL